MERLSQLIEAHYLQGDWQAIPLARNGTRLSHLMFADDVVLLGEASRTQANTIKNCLMEFCKASGHKISLAKSKVYFSPNTNEAIATEICNILGIQSVDILGGILEFQRSMEGSPTPNSKT